MFTQGLDKDAFRWVRAGGAAKNKDFFGVTMAAKQALDPITSLRNAGLPPSAKFRNGHLSKNIIPVSGNNDGSESDMDISSDSEEHVHDGQYSFISSPQDDKVHNVAAASMQKSEAHGHYGPQLKLGNGAQRPAQVCGGKADTVDKQISDSACSTEVSYMQYRSKNGGAPPGEAYNSDSYSSTVTSRVFHTGGMQKVKPFHYDTIIQDNSGDEILDQSVRTVEHGGTNESTNNMPTRRPIFHASGLGPWCAVLSYDACVRLCLNSWAKGCTEEAPYFLNQECAELRKAFGLQQVLLQPEEELLAKQSSELVSEAAAPKSKRFIGKMKVQVRKVKMGLDPPPGCNLSIVKMESVHQRFCKVNSMLHSGWEALRKVRVAPNTPVNGSFSKQSLAYLQASSRYIKEVSKLLKTGVTTLRSNSTSYEEIPETYCCLLKLKSSSEDDVTKMQPGSSETHVFLPDGLGDDLIVKVHDSKGQYCGHVLAQVVSIADDPGDKLRWWPIYHEPDHELVGRIQLYIHYSTSQEENNLKCGSVAETVAYDLLMEVAMKVQHFQERNLLLHGPWKWLVNEFASYYGVSDAYTKLRYLSYIMDVATPTADCLTLIHDLLSPVKSNIKHKLSHQENRILGEVEDQVQQILNVIFENYKSLDESLPSGMMSVFKAATGSPAPALVPAIKLYSLLHDILTPEIQLKFCGYFQAAAKKRSRRHQAETDEFILSNNGSALMDPMTLSMSYQKMKILISSIKNEIFTDIEIHKQNILPSFIDLPNVSAPIYSADLCSRLRAFLVSCPPPGPSRPVIELVIATADFQRDLSSSNIKPVKGGVEAKKLFHSYITCWIEEKRHSLLDSCRLDKVKCSDIKTSQSTTPFIDDMYDQLTETLNEYEIIISRWPEFTIILENAVADFEKAIIKALERQYADVLAPLKDGLAPKIIGKYVQKFTKGTAVIYVVPDELGVLLNSMKRILFVLHPKIETKLKSWYPCTPPGGNAIPGERLSEITVMLRADFRNHIQAIVEKLAENTKVQTATKLKKIIQDSKETVVESDVRSRIQPLKDLLINTIENLHSVFEPHVFITACRNFWDRMGQDVLHFMENRRENMSWYKGLRIAISVLDEIFAAQMQKLLGNALQEKDLEPPPSVIEVRSMFARIF
ncbi:Ribosomal protein L10 family protein isoform 2 [Gossypium australe]|uniref:Ribosomal protein L10 family protein isoform 2 n=1 Tax=Gossypium australe TaxID=47621 RepID=A0A5B6VXP8_9ROSI|nr:Ribosomal protein L10 family protein isoform 2 [Gossypium australe]